jgi:hypothetical protein
LPTRWFASNRRRKNGELIFNDFQKKLRPLLKTRQLKGAKAPGIPFKNVNNNSAIVKSNDINSRNIFYISLSLSLSLFISLPDR